MEKKIIFEYDEEKNILFTEDHWELWAREDVDEFFAEYEEYFNNLGKKVYIVSNINNLLVHAKIADYYGETAKNTIAQYILGFARWGTNDRARMTVRTTSLKANIPPNIYNSKEAAVKAIEEMKKEQSSQESDR
jgi:flavorubredoxin